LYYNFLNLISWYFSFKFEFIYIILKYNTMSNTHNQKEYFRPLDKFPILWKLKEWTCIKE